MNNKVFISGRVTGDHDHMVKLISAANHVEDPLFFNRHGVKAAIHGYCLFQPVNPTTLTLVGTPLRYCSWSVCMAVCLWHLTWCSYVYMLRDWEDSRGARIEHRWAKFLRKHIIYQSKNGGRK